MILRARRLPPRHLRPAATLALVLATAGCALSRSGPREAGGSLRVAVIAEYSVLATFVATDIRPRPRAPFSSGSLPLVGTGGGMVALTSRPRGRRSMLFVLHEGGHFPQRPSITVFAVSTRKDAEDVGGPTVSIPAVKPGSAPPCMSWSAFFVKGIGDSPGVPVELYFWQNDGPAGWMWVDPAQHTMSLRPVLRFSTRDVKALRNREVTYSLSVTATAGARPFPILGLMRRPDGSYTETLFPPDAKELGWSAFIHTPGEVAEISFYALDDPPSLRSACRGPRP